MASRELDRDKRVDLYHQAQQIASDNVPVIYTTLSERLTAVRKRLRQHDSHIVRTLGRTIPVPDGLIVLRGRQPYPANITSSGTVAPGPPRPAGLPAIRRGPIDSLRIAPRENTAACAPRPPRQAICASDFPGPPGLCRQYPVCSGKSPYNGPDGRIP